MRVSVGWEGESFCLMFSGVCLVFSLYQLCANSTKDFSPLFCNFLIVFFVHKREPLF